MIHKHRKHTHFVTLHNSTAQDKTISFAARGLLLMMLSHPSDWTTRIGWFETQTNREGRDLIKLLVKELESAGYCRRQEGVKEGGKFTTYEWEWTDTPHDFSDDECSASTVDVIPSTVNRQRLSDDGEPPPTKETSTDKKLSSSSGLDSDPDCFSPNEVAKLWNKECPSLPKVSAMTASRFKHAKARSDGDMAVLQAAFRRAEASDFIAGRREGKKAWAHIDWLLKPDNWTKLHEGRYDNLENQSQVIVDATRPVSQDAF